MQTIIRYKKFNTLKIFIAQKLNQVIGSPSSEPPLTFIIILIAKIYTLLMD